jgi:hypothetical protein
MARTLPAPTPATERPSAPRRAPGWRVEAVFLAGTLLVTSVTFTLVLRLWDADLRVPFFYSFDGFFDGLLFKGIIDHGWYLKNPSIGAPFGLDLHDFPLGGDHLNFLIVKAISLFSGNWAVVMNLYFLLSFLLISSTAYLVVRQIGVSRGLSLVVATLFSFLPYHFLAGEQILATYFAVPLGGFLVLDTLGWPVWRRPFLARGRADREGSRRFRWAVRAVLAIVIASAGSYYAPFTILLVIVAAGLSLLSGGDRRAAARAGVVMAMIGVVFLLNQTPTLLYRHAHGTNVQASVRLPGESDRYALHIVDMFLPVGGHRVPALAALKAKLDGWFPTSPVFPSPSQPLGALGALGLTLSLGALLSMALRPDRVQAGRRLRPRLAQLGALNVMAMLLAVSTGFSALLALAGATQLRVWSRMVIFIGFFALVSFALAVQELGPRLRSVLERRGISRHGARLAGAGLLAVMLVLGLADEAPAGLVPWYAYYGKVVSSDRHFVADIEARLPPGSAVFQLPLASFPERPAIVALQDYSLVRGYLYSKDLRWSYGAMRGRPADWTWGLGGRPLDVVLSDVTAAGFTGLYADRAGFPDQGVALEREMTRLTGQIALFSPDGYLLFWDLRPWADRQLASLGPGATGARANLVLHPVQRTMKEGFQPAQTQPPMAGYGDSRYFPAIPGQQVVTGYWAQSPALIELKNPLPGSRNVRVTFEAKSAGEATGPVTVSAPGMRDVTVTVGASPAPVDVTLVLPPGISSLRVSSPLAPTISASGATAAFWIQNVTILDVDGRPAPPPLPR